MPSQNTFDSSSTFSDPVDSFGGPLAREDKKTPKNRCYSGNVVERSLRHLYQEAPNYFRPPDVKTFVM